MIYNTTMSAFSSSSSYLVVVLVHHLNVPPLVIQLVKPVAQILPQLWYDLVFFFVTD